MLKKPRRLPQRYRRSITPQMRSLVQRRHQRQRQYRAQRWMRMLQKFQRRLGAMREVLMRYALMSISFFLVFVIGLLLFSPLLNVREIQVRRVDPRMDAEAIRQAVMPFFGEHLLLLSVEQIRAAVHKAIPDADTVSISKNFPSTIVLSVTPDPIIARLFIENPDTSSGASVLQETGSALSLNDYLTDEGVFVSYLPSQVRSGTGILDIHIVDWGVRPERGKLLVQSGVLATMLEAERMLQDEFGLRVENRKIYIRAREFHLRVPGYSLWFDMRSSLTEQIDRYRAFVEFIGIKNIKEYIDLRIRKMMIYK